MAGSAPLRRPDGLHLSVYPLDYSHAPKGRRTPLTSYLTEIHLILAITLPPSSANSALSAEQSRSVSGYYREHWVPGPKVADFVDALSMVLLTACHSGEAQRFFHPLQASDRPSRALSYPTSAVSA
jgi:hypothetical protein